MDEPQRDEMLDSGDPPDPIEVLIGGEWVPAELIVWRLGEDETWTARVRVHNGDATVPAANVRVVTP